MPKSIGKVARDALSGVRVLGGSRRTRSGATGKRHCGSNNSKGTELMEPTVTAAPPKPFPLLRIGNGPLPSLISMRSFFQALGRVRYAFRKPLVAI